ncbi:hypothetical protein D3C81_1843600 [compost metagenome]
MEPKAKVLPLRSARLFTFELAVMNLLVNLASCSRCTKGVAVGSLRCTCTKVKPPSQAISSLLATSDSTTAG